MKFFPMVFCLSAKQVDDSHSLSLRNFCSSIEIFTSEIDENTIASLSFSAIIARVYTKESLQLLKDKIDLVDVIESQIDLKRAGASYKALCPFHDEKSPSFQVKRGDSHYHCFGCGAHGDAIHFLMQLQGLTFRETVEMLAERYHVPLHEEDKKSTGPSSLVLQDLLNFASHFYHFYLLRTAEGKEGLDYLTKRGLSLEFIRRFEIGFAPKESTLFLKAMREKKFDKELLIAAGLLTQEGRHPFFRERITFPIRNPRGNVIGFSARKIREETFGGKYINTSETQLFKKSRHLFGLNYSRKRIVKEKRALLVEGQIDCLQLISAGLDYVVAALGTAFGEGHVDVLRNLGVRRVTIAFDSDQAGNEAASKSGALFQKVGVEVELLMLPKGSDPDGFLRERGKEAFLGLPSKDYLTFRLLTTDLDIQSPAGKTQFVRGMEKEIRSWDEPVMIHESLQRLARLVQLPEQLIAHSKPSYSLKRGENIDVDADRILEIDLLRLLLRGPTHFREIIQKYIEPDHLKHAACKKLYQAYLEAEEVDLFSVMESIDDCQVETCLDEIMATKLNNDKVEPLFRVTLQRLLDRQWLEKRQAVQQLINSKEHSDEEMWELVRRFDAIERAVVKE